MNREVSPQEVNERIKDICRDTAYCLRVAESTGRKSALKRGIYHYASDLIEAMVEHTIQFGGYVTVDNLLDGARDWDQYVWTGKGIDNPEDICRLFCSPSQQKQHKYGALPPHRGGNWYDFQVCRAMEASTIALEWLYDPSDHDGYNMLRIYSPKETSVVQRLVVRQDFVATWTNAVTPGHLVKTEMQYKKGDIIECHSWRPEGYVDCVSQHLEARHMFLSHETLQRNTASLY